MIYMGISVCGVYGEHANVTSNDNINHYRGWTKVKSSRVYSDEIQMATGLFAYERSEELRKQFKHEASRAWKRLV